MRTLLLAITISIPPTGACSGDCYDDGQDSYVCPGGGGGTPVAAELFDPRAFGTAGDHFLSLIDYFNNLDGSAESGRWLVSFDRSGSVLGITETDLVLSAPVVTGDGLSSTLVVRDNLAQFLHAGLVAEEVRLDGEATATFHDGDYWVAVTSDSRQLLHFDVHGKPLSKHTYPDDGRAGAPSLATDPLGDDIAAAWFRPETSTMVVERFRGGTESTFELAPDPVDVPGSSRWASPIAMRDGVVAAVFGDGDAGRIVLRSATDQVTVKAAAIPSTCREPAFVGTLEGYVLGCASRFIVFDATGTVVADEPAPYDARLASIRGGALAIGNTNRRIEVRDISNTIGEPKVVFEGESHEVEGGCSSTHPSACLGVLLLVAFRRRSSRASRASERMVRCSSRIV